MFCVNCGTQFEGKFCPECGTKINTVIDFTQGNNTSYTEVKELTYLRDARDCLLALSNEYSKILIEDVKGVQVKKEIEILLQKKDRLAQEVVDLETEFHKEIEAIANEANKQKVSAGKVALGVYTCGLSLLATGIHKKKKSSELAAIEENINSKKEHLESQVQPRKEEIENLINYADTLEARFLEQYNQNLAVIKITVNDILHSDKWLAAKANINPTYLNIDAIPRLIELLTYGRAATWREACNIYEDELFKARMINIGERQLSVQEDMLAAQRDLIELNIESINMQRISLQLQQVGLALQDEMFGNQKEMLESQKQLVANTAVLIDEAIKSNAGQQVLLKEMVKVRKNTGCSKNAALLSAFTDCSDMFFARRVKIV